MTGGKSPIGYLTAYLTNLYLSADSEKVQEAIEAGWNCPSLLVLKSRSRNSLSFTESSAVSSNEGSHYYACQKLTIYSYLTVFLCMFPLGPFSLLIMLT